MLRIQCLGKVKNFDTILYVLSNVYLFFNVVIQKEQVVLNVGSRRREII
jgi:hypothetical protein